MKKVILIFSCLLLISCGKEIVQQNCLLQNISFSQTINLSNPEFINIQVPGGYTITNSGGRNILIIRRTSSSFKAFDLQCPDSNCSSSMSFDGLQLKCSCNNKEYSSLNGSPIDKSGNSLNDGSCFALEYNVLQTSTNTLQITR